ncbi:hypothetical protein [Neobacillus mesonae]|uniref:hypothetical protein n=1 Tax=Neobacillus mesonae TaxID=1193713 RepID=UPI00082C7E94|nr:hypothetical protein [Neobacillus mesonae]
MKGKYSFSIYLIVIIGVIFTFVFCKNGNNEKSGFAAKDLNSSASFQLRYLDYQKPILTFPVRDEIDTTTWIQGASVNQKENELYIARQSNGGTVLTIEIRNLSTGKIKGSKYLPIQTNTYAEGLPWFKNSSGDLCFFVRQIPADKISIFNYTKNKVERSFTLLGGSKIGYDFNKKYIVTCNAKIDSIFVYDFESVMQGTPQLLHTIHLNNKKVLFEKPQGLTIYGDLIIFSQGGRNGKPAISVINFEGKVENVFYFNRSSYANMIKNSYPNLISNNLNYDFENEGIFMYKYNGILYPALVQIINGKTIIVLTGVMDGILINRQSLHIN